MAIQIPQGYVVTSKEAIDNRLVLTKEQMRNVKDDWMPKTYFAICADVEIDSATGLPYHALYTYDKDNDWDLETGKFKAFAGDYEKLANLPKINGVPVLGSEGVGSTYKLQDLLEPDADAAIAIRRDSEAHVAYIRVLFDGETIILNSEGKLKADGSIIDISKNPEIVELNSEIDELKKVDEDLQAQIDSEAAAIDKLNKDLDSEAARAKAAEKALDEKIDSEVGKLNDRIDSEVDLINDRIDSEVDKLNRRIDSEVDLLNDRIDSEVDKLNDRIDSEVALIDSELDLLKNTKQNNIIAHSPLELINYANSESHLYVHFDNRTILNGSEGLYIPFDEETIILNSEGFKVNIDNNTLRYNDSEHYIEVVEEALDLSVNPDFISLSSELDSERAQRIAADDSERRQRIAADDSERRQRIAADDSERRQRIAADSELQDQIDSEDRRIARLEGKVFYLINSEGQVVPIVVAGDSYDSYVELDTAHFTYQEGTNTRRAPFDFATYQGVIKNIVADGTATKYSAAENNTLRAKLAHVTPEDRNKWNNSQRKIILEDTSNESLYKNALLLYPHPNQTTKPVDIVSLRVDDDSIKIHSEGGYLELYANGYIKDARLHANPGDVIVVNSEHQPVWVAPDFGAVNDVQINGNSYVKNKIANLLLDGPVRPTLVYTANPTKYGDSERHLAVDIYNALPNITASERGKALIVDSENHLAWGEAGKVDALKVRDQLGHEKRLDPVNKVVTINVDKGLQITSEGNIVHINEITNQTRAAHQILMPIATDAQGHIYDNNATGRANGLREVTFKEVTNNQGTYVAANDWAYVKDPNNATTTTNIGLKIAGINNTSAAVRYNDATLKIDANGLSANYKPLRQYLGATSEDLIVINGNKVSLNEDMLGKLILKEYHKDQIDSEGLRDDKHYPTITLLKTELDAKQDLLTPIWPMTISSEHATYGQLEVHYDGNTIMSTPSEGLRAGDVVLAYLDPDLYLHEILPNTVSEGNPLVNTGEMQDAISSNLGRFVGNFTSEGDLPTRAQVPNLARNDYAFVTVPVYDSEGNVEYFYHRFKYIDDTSETGHWQFEYQVSGSTFTYDQLQALNSKWTLQLTNAYKAHVNNQDPLHLHVTQAEKNTWNAKQDKLSAGDHINAASLAANTIKVDAQTSISDATTYDSKLSTIGAIKGYFKKKQTPVTTAAISSEGTYFIASITQDAQGVITPKKYAYSYTNIPNKPQINGVELVGNKLTNAIIPVNKGIGYDTDNKTIIHTNAVAGGAQTTQEVYNIKYDAQGHITGSPTLYNPNWVTSVNNRTVASPTDSDIIKTVPFIQQGTDTSKTAVRIAGNNTASGANAVAIGSSAQATGANSLAAGQGSVASGVSSVAFGGANVSGAYSLGIGTGTSVTGNSGMAVGSAASVTVNQGFALGPNNSVSGYAGMAIGENTSATARGSVAEGFHTKTNSSYQHVQGKYNVANANFTDIVGWGTSEGSRKNISSLTTGGDLHLKGKVYIQSNDDGSGGIELVPNITGNQGKVLAVKTNGTGLEWVAAGAGGGVDFTPGNGLNMTSENVLDVTFGPYQAGSGITINNDTWTISTVQSDPTWSQIAGDPHTNNALNLIFEAIDSEKQDKLVAGDGIEIVGNVISNAYDAGPSMQLVNDVFDVKTPLTGNLVLIDGGWTDSEGLNFSIDTANTAAAVTSTPTKPVSGTALTAYGDGRWKKIQTAKADPTASGTTTEFIASITQNAQGVITATKKAIDLSGINVGDGTLTLGIANATETANVVARGSTGNFTANATAGKTLKFAIDWNDLRSKPTIPTVNNATLTLNYTNTSGTSTSTTFTANQATNVTANIGSGTIIDVERW